jgi:hypothetical protein
VKILMRLLVATVWFGGAILTYVALYVPDWRSGFKLGFSDRALMVFLSAIWFVTVWFLNWPMIRRDLGFER